jgi:hypothetical protein
MVKLFQLKASNKCSDSSFKDLLTLLKYMLPQDNTVLETIYEEKSIIYPLGLKVDKIHACKNVCILYCGHEYDELEKFPIFGLDRFNHKKDDSDDENYNRRNSGPKKALWYFPNIPRLKC